MQEQQHDHHAPPTTPAVDLPPTILTSHGTAHPLSVVGDRITCRIKDDRDRKVCNLRVIGIDSCATPGDRVAFVAWWRQLGGREQGLGYLDNDGKFVSFEPTA